MQSIILLYIKETDGRPADGAIQSRIGWEDCAPVSVQCFLIWSCSCPRLVWLLVDSPHLSIPRLVLHNMCSLSHVSLSGLLVVLVRLLLFPRARSLPVPRRILPVPLPEPSPPSPRCEERKPEPTEDGEFPPRSTSQCNAERLSRGSPRKYSPTHSIRCVSQLRRPSRGRKPWTLWARRGAPPPAPWLRVSLWWTWVEERRIKIWLTGRLTCSLYSLLPRSP